MTIYSEQFYDRIDEGARSSAQIIVPIVALFAPIESVCDVGCGRGVWLRTFKEHGTERIIGLDGDYVNTTKLHIPRECFRPTDLTQPLPQGERFDLVVSLEVAEHFPALCAVAFVRGLTQLSDNVLFSAAIPGQKGNGHVNEQWQSYWAALFARHGYEVFDPIRPEVWDSPKVAFWYKQNTLVYTKDPALQSVLRRHAPPILNIIHPQAWSAQ